MRITLKEFSISDPAAVVMVSGLTAIILGLKLFILLPIAITWQANLILGIGLCFFILGAGLLSGWHPPAVLKREFNKFSAWSQIGASQMIFLVMGVIFSSTAALAAGSGRLMRDWSFSVFCWGFALFLVLLGGMDPEERLKKPSRKTMLITLGLFITSTLIRAISIETIPPMLNGDEASAGLSAVAFIENEFNNIFGVGWFSFPALYFYLQSFFIRIFGQTTFALRFPSAIVGSLTVAVVYLTGRRIFSERAGLIAAIFLAGSHFHIHFSRIGLNNIYDGLWFMLCLGMLWDGWKNHRRSSALIAGISLGFAQYFYVTSRILVVIVAVWLLFIILQKRSLQSTNRGNLIIMLLAFMIISLPLGSFYIEKPDDFFAPFNRVDSLGDWLDAETEILDEPGWKIMTDQIIASASTFVRNPSDVWYKPNVPILRPVTAGFFIAGLVFLFFQFRKSRSWLIALWIGSFVLIGGFSVPVSAAQRYVAVLPACALVIGSGLDEIACLLQKVWENHRRLLTILCLLIIFSAGISDVYFYLFTYTPVSSMGGTNTMVAQRLADYLKDKENLQVAFFGQPRMGYYSIQSIAYLAPQIEGLDYFLPWGEENNPKINGNKVLFVFLPGNQNDFELVRQDFPKGTEGVELLEDGSVLYWTYLVSNPPRTEE